MNKNSRSAKSLDIQNSDKQTITINNNASPGATPPPRSENPGSLHTEGAATAITSQG